MKSTYLYIKQHSETGLKYFGKTTCKNPLNYKGSGRYWKRHIKKHPGKINTIWLKLFEDKDELTEYAIQFSKDNNIVKSSKWANEKPENGLDGGREPGFKGTKWDKERKEKYSNRMKNNNPMHSDKVREKHKDIMNSIEHKKLVSKLNKGNTNVRGKHWYNNGIECKMLFECPEGWAKGRLNPHWNYSRKENNDKIKITRH